MTDLWECTLDIMWKELLSVKTHPQYDILEMHHLPPENGETDIQIRYVYRDRTEAFQWLRYMLSNDIYDNL